MSSDEAERVQPLRLAIRTVRPGDTVEKLARRMPVGERAVQTFRVLNGLAPGEALTPGRKVKVVIE
jgi:predicted Zn-dependent protease